MVSRILVHLKVQQLTNHCIIEIIILGQNALCIYTETVRRTIPFVSKLFKWNDASEKWFCYTNYAIDTGNGRMTG